MTKTQAPHVVAVLATVAFIALGLWVLWQAFPKDDAYILFTYAENLAAGEGIVYNSSGPRTEGATDFLWMVVLAGLTATGVDIVLVALALNAAGLYLLTWLLARHSLIEGGGLRGNLHLFLLAAVILGSRIADASVAGFNTALYTAFCLLLFVLYESDERRQQLWVPAVAILIGLIRPDGVFIGVTATLLGLWKVWDQPWRKRYLVHAGVAGLVGVAYFLWRYSYFGLLLPLPLYVKAGSGEFLQGLPINILWLVDSMFFVIVAPFGAEHLKLNRRRYLLLGLPVLVLLAALSLTHQSQNIAFRFQSPALALLLYVFAGFLRDSFASGSTRGKAIFATVLALAATSFHGIDLLGPRYRSAGLTDILRPGYADIFASRLDSIIDPGTRIAVSEAGRIAFWTDAEVHDLVGLNTAEIALAGLDRSYLENLRPDLILVHTTNTLMPPGELSRQKDVFAIDTETLLDWLAPNADFMTLDDNLPERRAALAVYRHLFDYPDRYRIFLVRHNGRLQHLLALDDSRIDAAAFAENLRRSIDMSGSTGYLSTRFRPPAS